MAGDWKFTRRQAGCSACEQPFVEGETFYSLLRFQDEELERGDLCGPCFDSRDETQDLIFWRTRHSQKREAFKIDLDLVLATLPELTKARTAERRDLAFLLALLLVRHRRLRLSSVTRKRGREYLVLRKVRTQKTFEVEVRELDEERRKRLTERLTELLDPTREDSLGELSPAEPPAS